MLSQKTRLISLASLIAVVLGLAACGGGNKPSGEAGGSPGAEGSKKAAGAVSSEVKVDGSSTVFPIAEAMAEEFQKANSGVRVTVGSSGTGGGFKKFCGGETDISNASRPIKAEEVELCKKGKVEYIELPISYDGLSVVVNKENKVECLKVDDLKKMWETTAQGKIKKWNQVRPDLPDQDLTLYGPGTDSGTYDFFTKAVTGQEGKSRGDYTASEDDNTLVKGVAADKNALGFFGFAYYENNQDKLKLVAIDGGKGCIKPTMATINDGTYQPLSRPEFIYVKKEAVSRPEVKAFVEFQINTANKKLISEAGYVPLPDELMTKVQKRFQEGKVGSIFEGKGSQVGVTLKDLLTKEK